MACVLTDEQVGQATTAGSLSDRVMDYEEPAMLGLARTDLDRRSRANTRPQ